MYTEKERAQYRQGYIDGYEGRIARDRAVRTDFYMMGIEDGVYDYAEGRPQMMFHRSCRNCCKGE